jgi:phosphoribosylformylglycinamidine (FGAM) synthase-like enzyme
VRGIADASEFFGTPVVSGNVSFYNESEFGAVYPTPTIGMLGILERPEDAVGMGFRASGDVVLLVCPASRPADAEPHFGIGASEYLYGLHGLERGAPDPVDLAAERALHRLLVELARRRLVRSMHDLSEGGFAVALAECALVHGVGVQVNLTDAASEGAPRPDAALFGERQTRVILSASPQHADAIVARAQQLGLACYAIGETGGDRLRVRWDGALLVDLPLELCREAYEGAIPRWFGQA